MNKSKANKPRVIKDFEKLDADIKKQLDQAYPDGFYHHLVDFSDTKGECFLALIFETEDKIYLLKLSKPKAEELLLMKDFKEEEQINYNKNDDISFSDFTYEDDDNYL